MQLPKVAEAGFFFFFCNHPKWPEQVVERGAFLLTGHGSDARKWVAKAFRLWAI